PPASVVFALPTPRCPAEVGGLSLHDALPILGYHASLARILPPARTRPGRVPCAGREPGRGRRTRAARLGARCPRSRARGGFRPGERKSASLNPSHETSAHAVSGLKKRTGHKA